MCALSESGRQPSVTNTNQVSSWQFLSGAQYGSPYGLMILINAHMTLPFLYAKSSSRAPRILPIQGGDSCAGLIHLKTLTNWFMAADSEVP